MKERLARLRGGIDPRLLPVIVLLVAALVAVPMFVRDSDRSIAVAGQPALPSETATPGDGSGEAIVTLEDGGSAAGGAQRLGKRHNPFKKGPEDETEAKVEALADKGDAAKADAGGGGGGGGEPKQAEPTATPDATSTPTPTPADEPDRRTTWTPVVRFGADAKARSLKRLAGLPSLRDPLLLFMGLAPGRDEAVFLVAAGTAVVGEAGCWPSPENCKQIALAPDDEVDLVAATGQTFHLELRAVREREVSADAAREAREDVAPGGRMALRTMLDRVADLRYDVETGRLDGLDGRMRSRP